MAQTVNGQKNGTPQKQYRPGQRQQERMQRQARRQRRQRIWTASIAVAVLIILSVVGIIGYQRYASDRAAAQLASANATATKVASVHATATAVQLASCLAGLQSTPTPSAGPAKPPALAGTPVTLPDGLKYTDVQVGCGQAVKTGSSITVQYTGWLQSTGKKFDSSLDHKGAPFSLQLGQGSVIKGFDEGLMGMKQGGFRRIIIPPALAYGAQGQSPIPPNSVLIFDVQMLSVK